MHTEKIYEKGSLRNRFKDILTLALFTVAVAVISLIVMDILIYPISQFAVSDKAGFNRLIIISLLLIIACILFLIVRKIFRMRALGMSAGYIVLYMIRRPLYYIAIFFFFLFVSVVVIAFLYLMLSRNYYLIYKLTSGL